MTGPSATFGFRDVDASEKPGLVRGVFDRVAGRYDLMNDLMSAGVHRLWKDAVAARLNPQPGETIIDCAGGTGDMARRFAKLARRAQLRRGGADAQIHVVDYNAEMIAAGRERGGLPEITWTVGDAQRLPLPDAAAAAYVISFGIRNVTDIPGALAEARRVLKPGGRFLCLEFSRPVTEALRAAYDAYSFKVIPEIGARVANDRESYQYLVESIRRFPDQAKFARMIGEAGFSQVGWTNFTGGVAALHTGRAIFAHMASLGAFLRLVGAGWTLVRNDALLPREIEGFYSTGVRTLANGLRLFAANRHGRPGERLARSLEHLGPVAIKLGQFLSTRSDIFGRVFAEDLGRLKDRLPPFPTRVAQALVEQELGRQVEQVFASFGEPVAAASLAQAHDCVLLDGRRVAVKVLRPGIEARVAADCAVLGLAGRLLERWAPPARRLEPVAFSQTVIRATELELDLRLEAAGADELAEVMAADGYMASPKVVWDGVGKRVLTMEWAQGLPLSDQACLDQPGLDRKALADNLTRAFLAQALDKGVFHADLHEGNLFAAAPAKLFAVDFGIIGRLGVAERRYLAEILWGFLRRDYERVAQVHFDAGYVPAHHSVQAFAQALRAVGEPVFGRVANAVAMSRVLTQLFEITALYEMRLRPELVLLQKTMVTVEGVARRIDPKHDIWAAAEPVVRRWIARELSPISRIRQLAGEAETAIRNIARMTQAPPPAPAVVPAARSNPLLWFVLGAVVAVGAFLLGAMLG